MEKFAERLVKRRLAAEFEGLGPSLAGESGLSGSAEAHPAAPVVPPLGSKSMYELVEEVTQRGDQLLNMLEDAERDLQDRGTRLYRMQEETRQAAEELKLKEVSLKEQSEENLHTISDLTRTLNLRAEEVAALEEAVDHGTNQRKKLMHEVQSLAAERDRLNAQVEGQQKILKAIHRRVQASCVSLGGSGGSTSGHDDWSPSSSSGGGAPSHTRRTSNEKGEPRFMAGVQRKAQEALQRLCEDSHPDLVHVFQELEHLMDSERSQMKALKREQQETLRSLRSTQEDLDRLNQEHRTTTSSADEYHASHVAMEEACSIMSSLVEEVLQVLAKCEELGLVDASEFSSSHGGEMESANSPVSLLRHVREIQSSLGKVVALAERVASKAMSESEEAVRNLNIRVEELESLSEKQKVELDTLRSTNRRLEEKREQTACDLSSLQEKHVSLQKQLERATQEYRRCNQEVIELRRQVEKTADCEEEALHLAREITILGVDKTALQEELERVLHSFEENCRHMAEMEDQMEVLVEKNRGLKIEVGNLQAKLGVGSPEARLGASTSLEQIRGRLAKAEMHLQESAEREADLLQQLEDCMNERDSLQKNNLDLARRLNQISEDVNRFASETEEADRLVNKLTAERDVLRHRLDAFDKSRRSSEEDEDGTMNLRQENASLRTELFNIREDIQKSQNESRSVLEFCETTQQKNKELQQALISSEDTISRLRKELGQRSN